MKKVVLILALIAMAALPLMAQDLIYTPYLVDYYTQNSGPVPGAPDQVIRLINTGEYGTPLTSPRGDICANIYVFDNAQEMISCCACRLTPNELASASVGTQLTNNPVTAVVPAAGVIKIVSTLADSSCDPTAPFQSEAPGLVGFATHLQNTGGVTTVTETLIPHAILGGDTIGLGSPVISGSEAEFLPTACTFALYLGSGKGTCSCSVPGL
jgi:hypothetical protein